MALGAIRRAALAAAGLAAAPSAAQAQGQACAPAHASHVQEGTGWALAFAPVLRDAPGNPFNAFTIVTPDGARIEGGVYPPNGFGGRWGSMGVDCPEGGDAPGCNLWDGTVFQLDSGGLSVLRGQDTVAPLQVLFPDFARTLAYSAGVQIDSRSSVPSDVFTLRSCT